jgi:Leishmanolysin/Viral BACON domain
MTYKYFMIGIMFGFTLLGLASCEGKKPVLTTPTLRFPSLTTSLSRETSNTLTLRNTGEALLTYSVTSSNNLITLENPSGSIAAQNSASIKFRATCSDQPGSSTTTLSVISDGGNQSVNVKLECFEPYDIQLEFVGPDFTPTRQAIFKQAAARWGEIIVADLQDLISETGDLPATNKVCGFATPAFVGTIDDLLIFASIAPIDGKGKVLGQAGPALIRKDNSLTLVGCMQFDVADVQTLETEGTFTQTILHEMGHVLGFGSLWVDLALLDKTCPGTSSGPFDFTGKNAVLEFGTLGKSGNPPVENNFGAGTQCSHWDEDTFDNELMTGFLGGTASATVNPISALTVASTKDLGYAVDLSKADPYTIPTCSPNCDNAALRVTNTTQPWEIVLPPKGTVDVNGQFSLFENH